MAMNDAARIILELKGVDNATTPIGNVTRGVGNLAGAFGLLVTAGNLAKGIFDFSKEGAQLERLADAGAEVARQYGGDMDLIIQKVKEASHGTVSEMDIIASANRAMMLGLSADSDKLANLMEVAALRGRAMGVDTTRAFNDIVTGIGRASPLILDNLGIVVNAKETYAKYAESIGKSAGELTKAEKTQALMNAVLDEGNKMLKEAGGLALDNAAKVEKMDASFKNFADNRKRENSDLAGSFAESASIAIDGWDQFFKYLDNQGAINQRAMELRDRLDPTGDWRDFYETARIEWAAQQQAISGANSELERNAELAQIAADEIAALSEANAILIDGAISITDENKKFNDKQQDILDKMAEIRSEGEKLYPWEAEKIQENKDELAELGDQYTQNADDFRAAMEEKWALMAVDQIEMSDGVAGFSEAEFEKARVILETQDIATAAAFEEQQAMTTLSQAVADGTIPVENWGAILDQVMADGVIQVGEVQAAIEAVPKQNTITFDIITNGAPPNLDTSTAAATAPKGTHRRPNADGGMYLIPSAWGNEGFPLGNSDTASAGELITITPRGQQGGITRQDLNEIVFAIRQTRMDEYQLGRIVKENMLQVVK